MDSDAAPSILDDIILALQPGVDDVSEPLVLELTAADLISDGAGETIDLANVLAAGSGADGVPAGEQTTLFAMVGADISAVQTADATGSIERAGEGSILYTVGIIPFDDPAPS